MSHPDDDTRRAMARCEEQWLREPEPDDEPADDDFSATPYGGGALPADDDDAIPFP